jgi:AsmA protein
MSALGGVFGNTLHSAVNSGIPVSITGTTSNPSIRANVGAMVKQQAGGLLGKPAGQQPTSPGGFLKGLIPKPC